MGRLKLILALISHYKYAITIIIGVLTVGFVDENSFLHRFQLEMQISDLEEEIAKYNAQNESDLKKLKEMRQGPQAFQKIARERYFMKADDEDIYVLSDDPQPEKQRVNYNETTKYYTKRAIPHRRRINGDRSWLLRLYVRTADCMLDIPCRSITVCSDAGEPGIRRT